MDIDKGWPKVMDCQPSPDLGKDKLFKPFPLWPTHLENYFMGPAVICAYLVLVKFPSHIASYIEFERKTEPKFQPDKIIILPLN